MECDESVGVLDGCADRELKLNLFFCVYLCSRWLSSCSFRSSCDSLLLLFLFGFVSLSFRSFCFGSAWPTRCRRTNHFPIRRATRRHGHHNIKEKEQRDDSDDHTNTTAANDGRSRHGNNRASECSRCATTAAAGCRCLVDRLSSYRLECDVQVNSQAAGSVSSRRHGRPRGGTPHAS